MNDEERKDFLRFADELEELRRPAGMSSDPKVIMLSVNIEGWVEQLATKIREDANG